MAISKEVFIVHGHDDGPKEAVARLLQKVGLKPIILHEQPSQGRTVIEKFEDYSEVGFAVVLLTADDVGREKDKEELTSRARQNVIFEMGYFFALLSRKRVVTLHKEVELPSDLSGIIYIPYDAEGAWRTKLVQELKAANYDVDMNVLVERMAEHQF